MAGDRPKPYKFTLVSEDSQFYPRLREELNKKPWWTEVPKTSNYDLYLADRSRVKFKHLRCSSRHKKAVNVYRGYNHITEKVRMIKTMRAFTAERKIDLDSQAPRSFILVPQTSAAARRKKILAKGTTDNNPQQPGGGMDNATPQASADLGDEKKANSDEDDDEESSAGSSSSSSDSEDSKAAEEEQDDEDEDEVEDRAISVSLPLNPRQLKWALPRTPEDEDEKTEVHSMLEPAVTHKPKAKGSSRRSRSTRRSRSRRASYSVNTRGRSRSKPRRTPRGSSSGGGGGGSGGAGGGATPDTARRSKSSRRGSLPVARASQTQRASTHDFTGRTRAKPMSSKKFKKLKKKLLKKFHSHGRGGSDAQRRRKKKLAGLKAKQARRMRRLRKKRRKAILAAKRRAWMAQDEEAELREYAAAHPEKAFIAKSSKGAKGNSICISKNIDELVSHINEHAVGGKLKLPWAIQEYLDSPFLIYGCKFDIRLWVLVDPQFRIWAYRQGVCRVSSEEYTKGDLKNRFVHLTNHCIQTGHDNYGTVIPGNELFLDGFQEYLKKQNSKYADLDKTLRPAMYEIVRQTLLSIEPLADPRGEYIAFHLFGYDFMLDENFHTYLLEINASPASAEVLLDGMVKDVISLAIDPYFPPPPTVDKPQLERRNLFELIYDPKKERTATPTTKGNRHLN